MPQSGKLQENFFLMSGGVDREVEELEVEVEEEETEKDLVFGGGMLLLFVGSVSQGSLFFQSGLLGKMVVVGGRRRRRRTEKKQKQSRCSADAVQSRAADCGTTEREGSRAIGGGDISMPITNCWPRR